MKNSRGLIENAHIAEKPPLISVVIEGYNDSLSLGSVHETMEALKNQDFPLDLVEVILVGNATQADEWKRIYLKDTPFFRVKVVGSDGAHYYELKNQGGQIASGDIIAFTDSDAYPDPSWFSSIYNGIKNGADVVAGLTLFRGEGGWGPHHPLMHVAASISWGFIVGKVINIRTAFPRGFLSHNVGFRSDVFRMYQYRRDLGRTCAGSLLYKKLIESRVRIFLQPEQRVIHNFSLRWWVSRLHKRFGYEVLSLRRLDKSDPYRWVIRLKILEPLLTMVWHILLDIPQWFRFSKLLNVGLWRCLTLLPIVIGMSIFARGAEMIGMYYTIVTPKAMKQFAESN